MNRMTGILLMIIGIISFVCGIIIYSKADNAAPAGVVVPKGLRKTGRVKNLYDTALAEQQKESRIEQAVRVSNPVKAVASNKKLALEQAVKVAVADGVLTKNEKELIKELSLDLGLDYRKVLTHAEAELSARGDILETELVDQNKKSGLDFEKFIVKRFDKKYFELLEWTGDKFIDGQFSKSNYHPDLLLKPRRGADSDRFAVECKWKGRFYPEIIISTETQLARYRKFERENQVPVFIAIGIGGRGAEPQELFIVPLRDLESNTISMTALKRYSKDLTGVPRFDGKGKALD